MNHNINITMAPNPLAMTHTTREGKSMLIGQMSDSHLVNQIKLLCTQVGRAKAAARGSAQFDAFKARLYGIKIVDAEEAAVIVGALAGRLMPYLFEAALRRGVIDQVRDDLVDAFERNMALPSELPALPSPSDLINDDEECPF